MESLPSLPAHLPLRAFVIWATLGIVCFLVGIASAMSRRAWTDARWALVPLAVLVLGIAIGPFAPWVHTPAIWLSVLSAAWAAHRTTGLTSGAVFIGGAALVFAALIARNTLF